MVQRIVTISFSPTGTTSAIVQSIGEKLHQTLSLPCSHDSFTLPNQRDNVRQYNADTLVIFAMPTYAGRLPNKALPFLQSLFHGNATPAAAIVTFGNRSYDSSLAELVEELKKQGFYPLTAAAFATRHAFAHIGAEHPTTDDYAILNDFVRYTAERVTRAEQKATTVKKGFPVAPYYIPKKTDGTPAKFLKAKPKTKADLCTHCGNCADVCPMGAIDRNNTDLIPGTCIKCQACITACPEKAKYFDDTDFLSHKTMLETTYRRPAQSELFI